MMIRRGDVDCVIAGGAHSMLHPMGITGFNRLTALSTRNESPKTASRPFSGTRDGFVIGEGAAILILESLESAQKRGAKVLAEIIGYGSSADAFRVTDMHEDGRGGIVRLLNPGDGAVEDAVLVPRGIQSAYTCNLNEDPIAPIALADHCVVPVTVPGRGIVTVRFDCSQGA